MKKKWWSSLRVKIIAWSFVPTVIILSAVAWFTFYSYQRVLGDLIIKQYPLIVQPEVQKINDALRNVGNNLLLPIVLEIDTDHTASLEVRAQKILDYSESVGAFDGGIFFLDQNGIIFKTQSRIAELLGQDWSNTPQFHYINKNTNYGAWTDLVSLKSSNNKIFCISFAITGQTWDEFLGAGCYCFTVYPATQNIYYEALNKIGLDPNFILLDSNQQVVYSADQSKMGSDMSGEAYIQQLDQGESKSGRFRIGNQDMLVGYTRIEPMINRQDWFLLSMQSWSELMHPSLLYRQLLVALLALGVIVPVLVTAYGVRHITEPIQKLIQASQQVTAGQFKQRIEVKTGDEIETLADQFNLMSQELDESYTTLEKRVADRTRELAILNSIISVASHSLNVQEILENALKHTLEQMGFDAGAAFRFEPDSMSTHLIAHQGLEPAIAIELVNRYASTSQRIPAYPNEVTSIDVAELQDETLRERLSQIGLHLLVYIPLSTKGRSLGFFILGKREQGEPTPDVLSLLTSIGKQIGVAMENAHLYEQAEQIATTAERSRLARELHDAVTQTLFSANLIADVLPRIWKRNPEEGMQNLEELRQLTRGALAEMRTLLLEMRPESLERADLKGLLTQLAEAFIGRVRVPVSLAIQGDCMTAQEVKLVFYRVAQEALNNIARHSGARHVELRLDCQPGSLTMCIQDDGLGFDLGAIPPNHLGIAIMRERANSIGATLQIDSQLGQGTRIELGWEPAGNEVIDEDK